MQFIILLSLLVSTPVTQQDSLFFWQEVWQCVDENYVEINPIPYTKAEQIWQKIKTEAEKNPAQKDSILWANIKKMIYDLPDNYSRFIRPGGWSPILEEDKDKIDTGFRVKIIKQNLIVARIIPDSPADQAGIVVGDTVIKINGKRLVDRLSLRQIEEMSKISKDGRLILVIKRPDKFLPHVFILRANDYSIGNIDYEILENNILYLRIWDFRQLGHVNLKQVWDKIDSIPKGIILDLRDNSGGTILETMPPLVRWLEKGQAICIIQRHGLKSMAVIPDKNLPTFQNVPTVVLINSKTGSAAEIVAGALQDHQKAVLIGKKTFGKGSAYQVYELTGKAKLLLTEIYWLTPNGHQINKVGLQPDIKVAADEEDLITGRGTQFQKALEILKEMIK